MSYAHETCCAHLKIQYRTEAVNGAFQGKVLGFWECSSCRMLFAPQGRARLPQWIPISERMPTREDADELGEVVWKWAHGGTSAARFGSHPEGAVAWLPLPPEPPKPVGPDEVTVSVWPDGAMSLMHGHPPAVQVRYLRADLAEDPPGSWSATDPIRSRLPRKVRPLTDEECDDLLTKFEQGGLGYLKARRWYEKIMAARGIEVGE